MGNLLQKATPVIILIAVCGALIGGIAWMMNGGTNGAEVRLVDTDQSLPGPLAANELAAYNVNIISDMNPIAVLNTNKGVIEIELFENQMPITAGNFAKLVGEDFYNGIKFHRVIEGFMVQGGDPTTKTEETLRYGTGGPGYSIPDEHIKSDLLTNIRGTISMANSGPNSGGSQFFINLVDNTNLDFDKTPVSSQHPVFGRVIKGMEVVDEISRLETSATGLPLDVVTIESATIKRES
ncbi:MAG: peptidylprolyl isomerase [Candidatus Paceibacteria bacterium]|jgi:peptidylprolyl isomerase